MNKYLATGLMVAYLGMPLGSPSIIEAKNHVNCEEHLGSRIWEMEFLDKTPKAQRQLGMLFIPPEPFSGTSRRELMECIKRRVEEISNQRYSIYSSQRYKGLYVIREKIR